MAVILETRTEARHDPGPLALMAGAAAHRRSNASWRRFAESLATQLDVRSAIDRSGPPGLGLEAYEDRRSCTQSTMTAEEQPTTLDLIERAQQGEASAVEELMGRHLASLRAFLRAKTGPATPARS